MAGFLDEVDQLIGQYGTNPEPLTTPPAPMPLPKPPAARQPAIPLQPMLDPASMIQPEEPARNPVENDAGFMPAPAPMPKPAAPRPPQILEIDGDRLEFPGDMSDAEISQALAREYPDAAKSMFYSGTSRLDRITNPLEQGLANVRAGSGAAGLQVGANAADIAAAAQRPEPQGAIFRTRRAMDPAAVLQPAQDAMRQGAEQVVEQQRVSQSIPTNPAFTDMMAQKDMGQIINSFWRDPIGVIQTLGLQSLPSQAPALVASTVMGGGVPGAIMRGAAAGGNSAAVEYANGVIEGLQKQGVDTSNPDALVSAFQNPAVIESARAHAATRASIIGLFDAASMGLAGKTMAPAAVKNRVAREAINIPAQMGVQAGMGAAGEAGAQIATEGGITDPASVFAEALGETFTAPIDVASAAFGREAPQTAPAAPPPASGTGQPPTPSAPPGAPPPPAAAGDPTQAVPADPNVPLDMGNNAPVPGEILPMPAPPPPDPQVAAAAAVQDLQNILDAPQATIPEIRAEQGQQAAAAADLPPSGARIRFATPDLEGGEQTALIHSYSTDRNGNPTVVLTDDEGFDVYDGPWSELDIRSIDGKGTKAEPINVQAPGDVDAAAENIAEEPTPAQAEAGNYRKAHVRWEGLDIALETRRGGTRTAKDGSWEVRDFPAHYGYVKRTKGADGDQVDIFLGSAPQSGRVYVIDQIDPKTGEFDEHKVMAGVTTPAQARQLYEAAFSDGSGGTRIGAITPMSLRQFKGWLRDGETKKALAYQKPVAASSPPQGAPTQPPPQSPTAEAAAPAPQPTPPQADLYDRAVQMVRAGDGRISVSRVQRELGIGHPQIMRLIRRMVAEGVATGPDRAGSYYLAGKEPAAAPMPAPRPKATIDTATDEELDAALNALDDPISDTNSPAAPKASAPEPRTADENAKRRKAPIRRDFSVLHWLSRRGGMYDPGGDLKAMGADAWHRGMTGFGKLIRPGGDSAQASIAGVARDYTFDPDTIREAAIEEGYLPEGASIRDLYDLLAEAMAGRGGFNQDDLEMQAARAETDRADAINRAYKEIARLNAENPSWMMTQEEMETASIMAVDENYSPYDAAVETQEQGAIAWADEWAENATDERPADEIPFEDTPAAAGDGGARAEDSRRPDGPEGEAGRPSAGEQPRADGVEPAVEQTAQGAQTVIPGAGRISDKELAERKMRGAKKASRPQQAPDEGIFDTGARNQTDFLSPEPKPAVRKGEIGMMLEAGEVVTTSTGRQTTPFPNLSWGSERKAANTIKRADRWLMENALAEARARGDDFNARQFEANLEKPSTSDKDSAEAYLFDPDFNFPVPRPFLKPLAGPAKSAADQALDDLAAALKDPNLKFSLGEPEVNESAYERIKGLIHKAAEAILAEGHELVEALRRIRQKIIDATGMAVGKAQAYLRRYVADRRAGAFKAPEGEGDALSTKQDLERDRADAGPADGVRPEAVSPGSERDGDGTAAPGERDRGKGGRPRSGGGRVSAGGSAPVGARGDSGVSGGEPGRSERPPQPGGRDGGGDAGLPGLPDDRTPESAAADAAPGRADLSDRAAAQAAADKIAVKPADEANIRETLPLLLPEQQDDVLKAETRFEKPGGHGFLFTNATGTGKTYTGMGVIKRFIRQGKGRILIVAPSQGILDGWVAAGKDMGVPISVLDSKQDKGKGVVATTYANFGDNRELATDAWDLVVTDESHSLSSAQDGGETNSLTALRAITNHPRGIEAKIRMLLGDVYDEIKSLQQLMSGAPNAPNWDKWDARHDELTEKLDVERKRLRAEIEAADRSKVVFLSATPFAYDRSVDYAEGYLFEYGPEPTSGGYNSGSAQDRFFMQHFGYRMRTGRLTKPASGVESEVMEREFHEWLKREGALSGRRLEVDADYDRKFVLVDSAIGNKIDEALEFLREADDGRFRPLADVVRERFDYLSRQRLLEAIKAKDVVPLIQSNLDLGRKVVVFHDFNQGGGFDPFGPPPPQDVVTYVNGQQTTVNLADLYKDFLERMPGVDQLAFSDYPSPIETLTKAFGSRAVVYNGTQTKRARQKAKADFNRDKSGVDVIIIQAQAGQAGISLHDVTGEHQRVLYNLGMPTRPTAALQEEGRIYRTGQVSDAILRYMNTGTNWERWTFAQRIAERAGTAENLALGNEARTIRQAFIDAFQDSDAPDPGDPTEGKGGKERDRSGRTVMSLFQRAKTYYFGQRKITDRRDRREGTDYFATPEPIGVKMVEFSGIKPGEKILEPSAGHGAIARFFPETASRTLIEPSYSLFSRASLSSPGAKLINERFEDLPIVNKFDAIVMNPPYGSGGATAMAHLAQAVKHLRNGGRIVALIPDGPAMTAKLDKFMDSEAAKDIYMVADIEMPTVTFERAGTQVRTRIIVLDKQTEKADVALMRNAVHRDYSGAQTINDLFDAIENASIPERVEPSKKDADATLFETAPGAKVEINGTTFDISTVGQAAPKKRMGDKFAPAARLAEKYDGRYSKAVRAFVFKNDEKRAEFLSALEAGETVEAPAPTSAPDAVAAAGAAVSFKTAQTKHSKTGADLFVASIDGRVERDVYDRVNKVAKKHDGYYSAFRGAGAIPGFQFKTEANRKAFLDEMEGGAKLRIADYTGKPLPADIKVYEQLANDLRARLDQLGLKDIHLKVSRAIGAEATGRRTIDGMYVDELKAIVVAATQKAGWVLNHEAIHAMKALGLFTPAEWSALEKAARADASRMRSIRRRYSALDDAAQVEEAIADMFADWSAGRSQTGGWLNRAFNKIKRFLEAVRDVVAGKPEYREIFEAVESGEIGNRVRRDAKMPAGPATQTDAFKAWFGDSKVVDAEGKPIIVYHGTKAEEFDSFDPEKLGKRTGAPSAKMGFFFASQPAVAAGYTTGWDFYKDTRLGRFAERITGGYYSKINEAVVNPFGGTARDPDGQILPVYLKIENPYIVDNKGAAQREETFSTIIKKAKAGGHDGVIVRDTFDPGFARDGSDDVQTDVYIVFEPTQVKSALNSGSFDPSNPNIKFSIGDKQALRDFVGMPVSPFDRAASEWFQQRNLSLLQRVGGAARATGRRLRYELQDYFLPVKRTQAGVEQAIGQPLPESMDAYLREELYHGTVETRLEEFDRGHVEPLVEAMAADGVTVDELDRYLYARHAEERNIVIASRNPSMPDGGSGMTTADAQAHLAGIPAARRATLDALAARVDAINRARLDVLEQGGLLSAAQRAAWDATYQDYVPLRGFENPALAPDEFEGARTNTGMGFDIRGKESKEAMGRGDQNLAADILATVLEQYQSAVVRAEKNRVGQAFLEMVQAFPDPDLWEVNRVAFKRRINKRTGLVEWYADNLANMGDNVLAVKKNGTVYHITIKNPSLAEALKNLEQRPAGWRIMRLALGMMGWLTRFHASVVTRFNPEFVLSNAVRDIQEAMVNAQQFNIKGLAKDIAKGTLPAVRGVWGGQQGAQATAWQQAYREFVRHGGKTAMVQIRDVEDMQKDVLRRLKFLTRGTEPLVRAEKAARATLGYIANINDAVENGVRLATFKALRDRGISPSVAASIAKNITVNFNRRGANPWIGSLYLFFNAAIQGTRTVFSAIGRSRKVQGIVLGMVAFGFAQEMLNSWAGGDGEDEEDGVPAYDKVGDFVKQKSIVIVNPWAKSKEDLIGAQIPMSRSYAPFVYTGVAMGEVLRGKTSPGKAAINVFKSFIEAFNPIGSAPDPLVWALPEVLKPFGEIAVNKNFAGNPIMPPKEKIGGGEKPDSERAFRTVSPLWKAIAQELNRLTDGDEIQEGGISVSPETLEHLANWAGGGTSRFFIDLTTKSPREVGKLIDGHTASLANLPFLRRFLLNEKEWWASTEFYRIRDEARIAHDRIKFLNKQDRGDEAAKVQKDFAAALAVRAQIERMSKVNTGTRKSIDRIKADTAIPDEKRQAEADALKDDMDARMREIIKAYQQRKKAAAPAN